MSPDHAATADDGSSLFVKCPACGRLTWRNGTCAHGTVPPPSPDAPKEPAAGRSARGVCVHGVSLKRYCGRCEWDKLDDAEGRHDKGGEG